MGAMYGHADAIWHPTSRLLPHCHPCTKAVWPLGTIVWVDEDAVSAVVAADHEDPPVLVVLTMECKSSTRGPLVPNRPQHSGSVLLLIERIGSMRRWAEPPPILPPCCCGAPPTTCCDSFMAWWIPPSIPDSFQASTELANFVLV
jgi:hypothetical protein